MCQIRAAILLQTIGRLTSHGLLYLLQSRSAQDATGLPLFCLCKETPLSLTVFTFPFVPAYNCMREPNSIQGIQTPRLQRMPSDQELTLHGGGPLFLWSGMSGAGPLAYAAAEIGTDSQTT